MSGLTHLDRQGRARMVDVSGKPDSLREATARAEMEMKPETLQMIVDGDAPKGDVFGVARLAGIMAAKRTDTLIPLCHGLSLDKVDVDIRADRDKPRVVIDAVARTRGATGVEMEALTAASVAALTVYDMCKAVDRGMRITNIRLLAKSGGRSGSWQEA